MIDSLKIIGISNHQRDYGVQQTKEAQFMGTQTKYMSILSKALRLKT